MAKRGPDRSSTNNTYHLVKKVVKIGPVNPAIIDVQEIVKKEKKKVINASKI